MPSQKSSHDTVKKTRSDLELLRYRNPEKFGTPKFMKKDQQSQQEFYFPRQEIYGTAAKIATKDDTPKWLTAEKTYDSTYLTAQRIHERCMDKGNLQSRWTKERQADKEKQFETSKYGVPVKKGDIDKPAELTLHHKSHKTIHSDDSDEDVDNPKYIFGDPYENDPSLYFAEKLFIPEKKKKKKPPKKASKPKPKKTPKPKEEPEPEPLPPPPPTPIPKPPKRRVPKNWDLNVYDYVYFNARRVCTMPPTRNTPAFVDDPHGNKQSYCDSGLAAVFVHKHDYGQIPEYLRQRNRELGRPSVPDMCKFYRPHICRYYFGHTHCKACGRRRPTRGCFPREQQRCNEICATPKYQMYTTYAKEFLFGNPSNSANESCNSESAKDPSAKSGDVENGDPLPSAASKTAVAVSERATTSPASAPVPIPASASTTNANKDAPSDNPQANDIPKPVTLDPDVMKKLEEVAKVTPIFDKSNNKAGRVPLPPPPPEFRDKDKQLPKVPDPPPEFRDPVRKTQKHKRSKSPRHKC